MLAATVEFEADGLVDLGGQCFIAGFDVATYPNLPCFCAPWCANPQKVRGFVRELGGGGGLGIRGLGLTPGLIER